MQTLVLNYAYEPVALVGWQKAVYLILTSKADLLQASGTSVRSVSFAIDLPKVVVLRKSVRMKKRKASGFRKRTVFERDDWRCQYCTKILFEKTATLDHVIPRSKGGLTSYENTVCACRSCNFRKADRLLSEMNMNLLSVPEKPTGAFDGRQELKKAYESFMQEFAV